MKTIKKEDLKTVNLVNNQGSELQVLNYGAAVLSLKIKDKSGNKVNVVVSPRAGDFITSVYKEHNQCFGASVGRYAGRISGGEFKIDEVTYKLFEKDDIHLHGGDYGFQYQIWEIQEEVAAPNPWVKLSYFSKDGEEYYPGNLQVEVKYTLTENDELLIEYSAKTDKKTVVNITNHTYFNLNGGGSISDHFLKIQAEKLLELDKNLLPTGNLTKLKKHPKNFAESKLIGNRSLDDTFVLKSEKDEVAARLFAPLTGIKMEVKTNQKAMVSYAPEKLPDDLNYNTEIAEEYPSLCLEAQNFPDAPNFRNFPDAVLKPGEQYYNWISYNFSVSGR